MSHLLVGYLLGLSKGVMGMGGYLNLKQEHLEAINHKSLIMRSNEGETGIPEGSTAIKELDEKIQNVKDPATNAIGK